jgi:hypothetical protein
MDTPYTSRNHRILTFTRKTRILHVEDALAIGRLRFEIYRYQRGEGAQASVEHYLTYTDALPLLADLAHGTLFAPYTEQKGSLNQSKPVARHFTIEPGDEDPLAPARSAGEIKLTIANGPGEVIADDEGNLSIKPKSGAQPTTIDFRLDRHNARVLGHTALLHVQAWATATYQEQQLSHAYLALQALAGAANVHADTLTAIDELIRELTRDAGGVATAEIWATGVRALKAELHRHNHEAAEQRQHRARMIQRIRELLDQDFGELSRAVKDGLPADPTWPFTWNADQLTTLGLGLKAQLAATS